MVPSGPPTPGGGAQNIPPYLIRSNSGIVGAQGGSAPSQHPAFSSLLSPRSQYNSFLGNISNVSSLLNQSFGNGGSTSGLSGSGSLHRGGVDMSAESEPLSRGSNGMSFTHSSTSFVQPSMGNQGSSNQTPAQHFTNTSGNQMVPDQKQQPQQIEAHNFQHSQQSRQQLPVSRSQQLQQQQYQSLRGGLTNMVPVKMEPGMSNDRNAQQQQLQSLRNPISVKLESQQPQSLRSPCQVKMETQHSEQSLFLQQQLQQQQHQQQFVQISRQNSQAAAAQMSFLKQQHILQLQQQQQQQQQILKSLPQQQFQQSLPVRPAIKPPIYEPGMCARRLTHYMHHQQQRPADNNIDYWRKFVAEYFAPHAKKRWCVSLYGSGRQTTGVFPQDVWHCEICNRKPGRGFETTAEVLPRLCKIKYDSGTLEELLYVDMPREYQNASGQIVLDYAKAIQESVFEQLRVVRDGQLRIVFSPDLKICSWEFCARRHEELIPRRLIIPQVSQLGVVAQKYQAATQNASSGLPAQELQNNCNMFVASARQLAKALEVPLVNDLGYTKRYVRCLQISEVVNSMKDLIDYSRETGTGPMASLINFPRRTATSSVQHGQGQQPGDQPVTHNSNDQNSFGASVQLSANNGLVSAKNSLSTASTSTSAGTMIAGLLHQNSMNSRQENSVNNANSPYGGNTVQVPSAGSSTSLPPQSQPKSSSPFSSPTPSASNNNAPQPPHNRSLSPADTQMNSANSPANIPMQQMLQSQDTDCNDSQSSVQQIIQEMIMSSQLTGGGHIVGVSSGNEVKNINGIMQTGNATANDRSCLIGKGVANSSGINGAGYGNMNGTGALVTASGIRAAMANNPASFNRSVGIPLMTQDPTMNQQQQDLRNRLLSGLGAVNGLSNHQFDWKSSP
ncbi:transcriptional corepressor SEUSS [Cinnamomum micranthum f. kanehirae]|uniref:Transcriptional corepressor SEUSS n=1 Tax=Cinnamomum micranthum f. kanehirae TaxID=337451 RepID=A0A443PPW4_9MAGN|nr:transcriptional corepressor SEUSS [Cinnamomum micranthum f. kanehirae]